MTMTTAQVCSRVGITYRQIDYWTRSGLIPGIERLQAVGSGNPREWTHREVVFLVVLARLAKAGVSVRIASEALSAAIARGEDIGRLTSLTLSRDVTVQVRPLLAVSA